MRKVLETITQGLEAAAQLEENLKPDGPLATSVVRCISSQRFREVKHLDKARLFALCEDLLESRNWPERAIAFDWAFRCRKRFEESDFATFERWLNAYVDCWGSCDNFCTHAFGSLILQYPALIPGVLKWTESDSRWFRRAAAVVMIYSARRGDGQRRRPRSCARDREPGSSHRAVRSQPGVVGACEDVSSGRGRGSGFPMLGGRALYLWM
jgi:hypothetical protein